MWDIKPRPRETVLYTEHVKEPWRISAVVSSCILALSPVTTNRLLGASLIWACATVATINKRKYKQTDDQCTVLSLEIFTASSYCNRCHHKGTCDGRKVYSRSKWMMPSSPKGMPSYHAATSASLVIGLEILWAKHNFVFTFVVKNVQYQMYRTIFIKKIFPYIFILVKYRILRIKTHLYETNEGVL